MTNEEFLVQVKLYSHIAEETLDEVMVTISNSSQAIGVPYKVYLYGMSIALCSVLAKIMFLSMAHTDEQVKDELITRTSDIIRSFLDNIIEKESMADGKPSEIVDEFLSQMKKKDGG